MSACPKCLRPTPTETVRAHADDCRCADCAAACWDSVACCDRLQIPPDVAAFVIANLPAMEQLARVAKLGGQKYGGGYGPGAGQTVEDHARHASHHTEKGWWSRWYDGTDSRDPETGELDLAHAATRLVMALGVIARGGR